jgi:peptidyl-prolyl isomerase H (cyclophilin H)
MYKIAQKYTINYIGKYVVFGVVIEGHEVIDKLNKVQTDRNDRPIDNIRIIDCGEIYI